MSTTTPVIDAETHNKVSFITFIIPQFARAYKMNPQKAYLYLLKYGGIDFIDKHWWALHTDNPFWSVRSLFDVCYNNGGRIETFNHESISRQ
ncbi:MAG: DUF3791 domain-containing protein [Prevotellaceae bacterium]|nr:DUF3791 domain-containing protein [Prevotellaceae bacterium]